MEHEQRSPFRKLICEQLDDFSKRLFQLCSIPSFFTRHLIISCLPALNFDNVCATYIDINRFLSLPFISRRATGTGTRKTEYFMIHQLAKNVIPLSLQEYRLYGNILIEYFDTICATDSSPLREKYFYEKLLCEIKMNQITSWQSAYQAAVEMSRLQECNKLIELLRFSSGDSLSDWYTYYGFVNQYINKEPIQELIPKLERTIHTVKFSDKECTCYLLILLGVLYDTVGRWNNSRRIYEYIISKILTNSPTNSDLLAAIHINLASVCCRMNDLDISEKHIASVIKSIDNFNLGVQIAAYRTAGFYAKRSYQWELAKSMYQCALVCMENQQKRAMSDLSQIYDMYRPFPVYRSDEAGIYNCLGEIFLAQGNFQRALEYHKRELQAQIITKDEAEIAWAEYNLGKTQYLAGDTESACNILHNSIIKFNNTNNKANRAYPLGELSNVFQYVGRPDLSLQCLEESISILLQSKDIRECLSYLKNLGIIGQAQGFLTFAGQIFELCLSYHKTYGIGWILNSYARNFMFHKDYCGAEIYFFRAREIFTKNFDKRGLSYVYNNLGELYVKMGKLSEANALFDQSLSMKLEMGDQHAICYTYRELGEFFLHLNDWEQAAAYLELADKICREGNYVMLQGDIALSQGKLMIGKKEYNDAFGFFERAIENYKKQNYLSRIVNCCQIQCGLAEEMGEFNLYSSMKRVISQTMERKEEEELLMISNIKPLIERVRDFI